ncbi:MAG: type II secretion system protein [Phycisphaera sp. RhM]|nr:type II secretion system protein [Phycisphaera sp. RhM]
MMMRRKQRSKKECPPNGTGRAVGVQALAATCRCIAATGSRLKARHRRLRNCVFVIPVPLECLPLRRCRRRTADRPRSAANAFTLIEMIVALVLASLMMVGLLGIVASVSTQSTQLRREQFDHVAAGTLADRLRNDLINARGIAAATDTLILSGYVSPQQVPGMIRYTQATIGTRRLLIRRAGGQRDVCWIDFGAFEFETYDEFDAETPVPDMTGGLLPMPSRFRIAGRDAQGRILFDEVIDHHAD